MAMRNLSPRLAGLVADHDEIRDAMLANNVLTTHDLGTLASDADIALSKLRLSETSRAAFHDLFGIARSKVGADDDEKMQRHLDVINSEGQLMMTRPRADVHRNGFWHRGINIWVICPATRQVLLGQRSMSKDHEPRKWTCVCGRVPSGELSYNAAVCKLVDEFSIGGLPDEKVSLLFSMRVSKSMTRGPFAGQQDNTCLDVYVACLEEEIPVHRILLDVQSKQAAKYVPLSELQRAFDAKDENYVQPPDNEYTRKLIHYLRKICEGSALTRSALPERPLRPGA